jgi:hypothetical protein
MRQWYEKAIARGTRGPHALLDSPIPRFPFQGFVTMPCAEGFS